MSESAARPQFTFIQALRGFAALWVVFFHLESSQALLHATAYLPSAMTYVLFQYGRAGVAAFFVLSGFVICHSLIDKPLDARGVGRFMLKRSARLDPPYWTSMLFVVAVEGIMALAKGQSVLLPGFGQVAAHVLYLQTILHVPEIQIVYWTLTYEFQFYIVFALFVAVMKGMTPAQPLFWLLYGLALVAALLGQWAPTGIFVNLWHGFFLGVLAYQAGRRRVPSVLLFILALATVIGARHETEVFGLPCALTAILLFGAMRAGRLGMMAAPVWQGLGAISYSLYLVHVPTLRLLTGILQRILGRGALSDAATGIALIFSCLAVATLFYLLIEKPSKRLAQTLFSRPKPPAAAVPATSLAD